MWRCSRHDLFADVLLQKALNLFHYESERKDGNQIG